MFQPRIIKKDILTSFSKLIYLHQQRIYRVWIISPWIRLSHDIKNDPVKRIFRVLKSKKFEFNIITRQPNNEWHQEAIDLLKKCGKCSLFYHPNLHTKLYILECSDASFEATIFGSPNLTPSGNTINRELAIEFRKTLDDSNDPCVTIMKELKLYASSLRGEEGVIEWKK